MGLTAQKVASREEWLQIMKEESKDERQEALDMMREGLAIQMYNELRQYSSKQQDVAFRKSQLLIQMQALQQDLASIEKEERLIQHEIVTRKEMLKKLSKQSS